MHNRSKLILTALVAAFALSALVGTASANRLSVSNQNLRVVWSSLTFSGGGFNVRCPVTLEGSFHYRSIVKSAGSLIGFINRAIVRRPCTGGEAFVLNGTEVLSGATTPNSLPWHVQYDSFTGTLPRPTGVRLRLVGAAFLIRITFLGIPVNCLFRSTEGEGAAFGIANLDATGRVTGLRADETSSIPLNSGSGVCPEEGSFSGTGTVTVAGSATPITVTLI